MTLYYYSIAARTRNSSYIFPYVKLYDVLVAKWRLRRYTLHEAMMSSRKTIRPRNVDAQGILNIAKAPPFRDSREDPACLRVRITGKVYPAILTKLTAGGETCVAVFCAIPRKMLCAASTEEEEEAVKVPGSIPRAATEKTALHSLAVRSRSRDLKYLLENTSWWR